MDFTLKDLFGVSLTDHNYANSVARWLTVQTENSQVVINAAATVATLDEPEDVSEYVSSLSSEVRNTSLIYFPDDDNAEAQRFTVEQALLSFGGVEVQGLPADKAESLLSDLAGSTAAVTAAAIGIQDLCSADTITQSELLASIEAQVGGISDQMLSITSVIGPAFSDANMALRDKIKAVFNALGLTSGEDYSGFGPIHSDNYEMTGLSGVQALGNIVGAAITAPVTIVRTVATKLVGFLDKVFGGIITKVKNAVASSIATIVGTNDACKTRDNGEFTDLTCDNADLCVQIPSSYFSASLLTKVSYKYAMHMNAGFGAIDLWFSDNTNSVVNMVIHWKPIDIYALMEYANEVDLDEHSNPYWTNPYWIFYSESAWSRFYGDISGRIYEAESASEREAVLQSLAAIFNTNPAAGSAGVSDDSMFFGILASQMLALAILVASCGDGSFDSTNVFQELQDADFSPVLFASYEPDDIKNVHLMEAAGMAWEGGNIVHVLGQAECASAVGKVIISFLTQSLTAMNSFSLDLNDAIFVPYYYISSFQTGKYSILSDADVQQRVNTALYVVAAVVVAILAIKIILAVKKKMWVAQASLDYQAFEIDVATNAKQATKLYKKSCRIAIANNILGMVTGSAKTAVSKISGMLTSLGNTITARVSSVVSSGTDDPASSSAANTDLSDIKRLISSY